MAVDPVRVRLHLGPQLGQEFDCGIIMTCDEGKFVPVTTFEEVCAAIQRGALLRCQLGAGYKPGTHYWVNGSQVQYLSGPMP